MTTLKQQNSWFADCCLDDPDRPLTHTLGYVLRGVLEADRLSRDEVSLDAAMRTADGLADAVGEDGFLPGRFDRDWRPAVSWSCLTGSVQLAFCWLQLFSLTGEPRYLAAGCRANRHVRRTIAITGPGDQTGGVRGSFPISSDYGRYQYLNWAAKFAIDSFRKEIELSAGDVVN